MCLIARSLNTRHPNRVAWGTGKTGSCDTFLGADIWPWLFSPGREEPALLLLLGEELAVNCSQQEPPGTGVTGQGPWPLHIPVFPSKCTRDRNGCTGSDQRSLLLKSESSQRHLPREEDEGKVKQCSVLSSSKHFRCGAIPGQTACLWMQPLF